VGRVGIKPRSEGGSERRESLEFSRFPDFKKPMVEAHQKLRENKGAEQFGSGCGHCLKNLQEPNRIGFRGLEIAMLQEGDHLVDGSGYGYAG
jgi:hypothetical protein